MKTFPQPVTKSGFSVEEAIAKRRSARRFSDVKLTEEMIS